MGDSAADGPRATSAVDAVRADYDVAPYESFSHPRSAPGHVAAIAMAFGADCPDVSRARVLEIGCAAGGNLTPFAAMYPDAHAVGIDLSQVQIEQGRRRVRALGLTNVELIDGDIGAIDLGAFGTFEYIVCHGVYSWVPREVQHSILAACRNLLTPNGIAYLSYNVYPGWKAKEIVRDAMLLRAPPGQPPQDRIRNARAAVDFLQRVAAAETVLGRALSDYQALAAEAGDYYLLHEELEAFNLPCYFRDFVATAREHGLDYLADAQPQYMFAENYGAMVAEELLPTYGHDQILLEQHLDFVSNRTFRESLLIRAGRVATRGRRVDPSRLDRLHVSAWLPPIGDHPILDAAPVEYGEHGGTLVIADPVLKAALGAINDRWPWTLSREELLGETIIRLVDGSVARPPDLSHRIDSLLEALIVRGHARCRVEPVVPSTPITSIRLDEPARRLAELTREDDVAYVVNRWHETMPLEPLDRFLLPLLDGSRDRDALLEALMEVFRQNVIQIDLDDGEVLGETDARQVLAAEVDALPQRLAELRLLHVVTDE